jgi:hypothetical protein
MGTGTCIALIAAEAILRYAVTATSSRGVNIHVAGLILLLAGVLGLLLSLLVWGPLNPARRRANDLPATTPAHRRRRPPPGRSAPFTGTSSLDRPSRHRRAATARRAWRTGFA